MARLLLILSLLNLCACALTAPKGNQELLDDIKRDKASVRNPAEILVGKPLFIRVRAYPRIDESNVYGKHWILMKIGNEKMELSHLINETEGK